MKKEIEVWAIQGASYDGCNGWTTWVCGSSYFSTKEKAEEFIKDRWGYDSFIRHTPIKHKITIDKD